MDKRYVLERRLGKGGMGSVYRAKHVHLKSTHAIKIISPEVVRSDQSLLVRFTQEAILVASIHHPNIVSVTDFGIETADTLYLVMEYIEGISLDEFLRNEKRLSPAKAFEILKPIALGVGAAHGQGITHRDLKPLNVMLRTGAPLAQAVKVLDFGLAKIKSTESFSSLILAKTTNLLGSPHYMPPEQWDNENVDTRSDIYSIGIMLFQMLTGDVPFKGDSMP
ncbi:MAG: serine/threonine-protein kinase, partial [Pyrinomonadaceae bacterium]